MSVVPRTEHENAQACGRTRNQGGQKHALFQAGARASPASSLQCHGPPAGAYLQAGQYQPQQSTGTQRCRL